MAKETEREAILQIVVNNGEAIKNINKYRDSVAVCKAEIARLKEQQAQYKQALDEGKMSQEQFTKANEATKAAITQEEQVIKTYNKTIRETEYQIQKNIQANTENEGSLKALRGQLSTLTKQYDELSKVDREGKIGEELQSQIAGVYNQLKMAEEETGRFQRNVGNYGMKSVEAFKATAGAGKGVIGTLDNMKTGVTALKTASGWIGLVVGILAKVVQAIGKNEVAMNAIRKAMAPLREVGVLVGKMFEKLGDVVAKVSEKFTAFARKIGLMKDAADTEADLTEREIAFDKKRRENMVKNAETERTVADLRAKNAEKDKYTASQRVSFLEQAVALEEEISRRNKQLAQEEYEIALARSKQGANSKEDNDRLAQLQADAIRADTEYLNKVRELNSQLVQARKEAHSENVKTTEETTASVALEIAKIQEGADFRAKIIEERLKQVEKGTYQEMLLQQEKLQLEHDAQMRELEQQSGSEELRRLMTENFNAEMLRIEEEYQAEQDRLLTEETDKILAEAQARFDAEKEIEAERVAMKRASAAAIGGALGSISQLMAQMGEEESALAKASKVLALAQIAIETGVATATGISSAAGVPFPANIPAIASVIATIASGMASAITSVKSAKFARGGLVEGPGTGTSDSIPARLSNGEAVMTAQATSMFAPLLSSLNQIGGGNAIGSPSGSNTEVLENAIARGMASANVSVSVTEIDTVRERMEGIKGLATY